MSVFASESQATVAVPFAAPHTVTLQKVSGRVIEKAQAEDLKNFQGGRSPRGWSAVFQRALAQGTATDADAKKAIADPLAGYDRMTLVHAGLKGWSFTLPDGTSRPVTAAAIEDLDDEALEFIAVEIMRLTKPQLFLTPEEREAAKKKD